MMDFFTVDGDDTIAAGTSPLTLASNHSNSRLSGKKSPIKKQGPTPDDEWEEF